MPPYLNPETDFNLKSLLYLFNVLGLTIKTFLELGEFSVEDYWKSEKYHRFPQFSLINLGFLSDC